LKVEYRARSLTTIQQGGPGALGSVSFETDYQQNTKKFNKNLHSVFWVVLVVALLQLVVVTYFYFNRPTLETDHNARCLLIIIRVIINSFDLFANFFFWFIFAATGWVFIFFKLQDRVYTFMPPLEDYDANYKQYDVLFGIVTATKLISVLFKIYFDQCSMKLFLIDWERPKLMVHNFMSFDAQMN
jgi:hypothetical protein